MRVQGRLAYDLQICSHVCTSTFVIMFDTITLHYRSTQPCIPPGSLNRVSASAGVRAGMSPLPGGR